jgi:hypothetical protein
VGPLLRVSFRQQGEDNPIQVSIDHSFLKTISFTISANQPTNWQVMSTCKPLYDFLRP